MGILDREGTGSKGTCALSKKDLKLRELKEMVRMLKSGWGWTENGTYESLIGESVNGSKYKKGIKGWKKP
jgi:hypothetical protein